MAKRPPGAASGASSPLAVPCAEEIDRTVAEINRLHHRTRFDAALAVGRYVLGRYFDGSRKRFKLHHRGHLSNRALAAHPQLAASPSYLNTAVRILDHVDVFPPEVLTTLSLSWHRAVLPIADVRERLVVVDRVLRTGGGYPDLLQRVRAHTAVKERPVGRPRASAQERLARRLEALAPSIRECLAADTPVHLPADLLADVRALLACAAEDGTRGARMQSGT